MVGITRSFLSLPAPKIRRFPALSVMEEVSLPLWRSITTANILLPRSAFRCYPSPFFLPTKGRRGHVFPPPPTPQSPSSATNLLLCFLSPRYASSLSFLRLRFSIGNSAAFISQVRFSLMLLCLPPTAFYCPLPPGQFRPSVDPPFHCSPPPPKAVPFSTQFRRLAVGTVPGFPSGGSLQPFSPEKSCVIRVLGFLFCLFFLLKNVVGT